MEVNQFQSGSLELWIGRAWISSNVAILKFRRKFLISFLACRRNTNKVEEELKTKMSTDFQQNNMPVRVCDCRPQDSDSIITACLIESQTSTCLSHLWEYLLLNYSLLYIYSVLLEKGRFKNCLNSSLCNLSSAMAARQISRLFSARTPRLAGILDQKEANTTDLFILFILTF